MPNPNTLHNAGQELPIRTVSGLAVSSALEVVGYDTGPVVAPDPEHAVIAEHDIDPEVSVSHIQPDLIDEFGGVSYAS